MADFLKYLGISKSTPSPSPASEEADFADFAGAPDPSPASVSPVTAVTGTGRAAVPTLATEVTFTKWYRVWERTSPSDFYQEAVVLPLIIVLVGLHIWGRRKNRRIAKGWLKAHGPALEQEYAVVGFEGRKPPTIDDVQSSGLAKATAADEGVVSDNILKEKTAQEFITYATGRQNVAFLDIKLSLFKRYNPLTLILELVMSFFLESVRAPAERMEATAYAFDGREKDLVPVRSKQDQESQDSRFKGTQSAYDGFVWAVVHKECMRYLRDDRYDLSLTGTKDHAKLPIWATVMSESAEITDLLLTTDLIKAVESAGDDFEYLIITDQPLDKPIKLNEATPRKRLSLSIRLPASESDYSTTHALFAHFLRLPDALAHTAHFRPEVQRKLRGTREEELRKLRKADEGEKAEERKLDSDRRKKELRDSRLKGMSAEEQRKFLEREREKGNKKQEKKMSRKA